MGQKLEDVLAAQERIKGTAKLKLLNAKVSNEGLKSIERGEFDQQQQIMEDIKQIPKSANATWDAYQKGLSLLKSKIDYLVGCLESLKKKETTELDAKKTEEKNRRVLELTLLVSVDFLAECIAYLQRKKEVTHERLDKIGQLQQAMMTGLDLFPLDEANAFLLKELVLNLSVLKEDYNKAYAENYGRGRCGFFELPIKRLLQQKSRAEELQFIEAVNTYLQNEGERAAADARVSMQCKALNLVRLKIEKETFGQGSQLRLLIKTRLSNVGCLESNELNEDFDIVEFIKFCQHRNIYVPESITSCYMNEFERHTSSSAALD